MLSWGSTLLCRLMLSAWLGAVWQSWCPCAFDICLITNYWVRVWHLLLYLNKPNTNHLTTENATIIIHHNINSFFASLWFHWRLSLQKLIKTFVYACRRQLGLNKGILYAILVLVNFLLSCLFRIKSVGCNKVYYFD